MMLPKVPLPPSRLHVLRRLSRPVKGSRNAHFAATEQTLSAGFVDDEEELKGRPVAADDDDEDATQLDSLDAAADAEDEDEEEVQVCCNACLT